MNTVHKTLQAKSVANLDVAMNTNESFSTMINVLIFPSQHEVILCLIQRPVGVIHFKGMASFPLTEKRSHCISCHKGGGGENEPGHNAISTPL